MNAREVFKRNFLSLSISPIIMVSKFSILFPKYQEKNLIEKWFIIRRIIRFHDIETTLNLKMGIIEVSTTVKTVNPYSIIDARDFIKLISRGVPIHQAAKIFNENVFCDIVKISSFTRNKKKFLNRRKRIIGTNGSTIKVIELLTKSYILVQGNTVSCIGNFKNVRICRKIIEDCMKNIHPILHVKNLMIKKKLLKSPLLKNESWEKFLPLKFSKKKQNNTQIKYFLEKKDQKQSNFSLIKFQGLKINFKQNYLEYRRNINFK